MLWLCHYGPPYWSRSTSNFYACGKLLCIVLKLVYFDSWNWQSFVSTCHFFNCLFPLDVQNEKQMLSRVLVFVFHFAWCVRGFKSLKRFWSYFIAFSSCISMVSLSNYGIWCLFLRSRYENATPNLFWVSCAINKGGFFEIAFVVVVNTHLPRFEALAYVLPHFDALTLVVIRVFSAFIFQTFAEVCYSVFVNRLSFKSVLNLRKVYIFKTLLKVYYRSVFNESSKAFIFQMCTESLHPE